MKPEPYVDNQPAPTGSSSPPVPVLLLVAAIAVAAAQNEAWASALGTAITPYSVLATSNQDRRN
ncbi:hypothetical protein ACFVGY_14650 [Streptomyces sp. NPDC127106]|uniref:hypothetical protein n=1 Tax=Streptomyces sp. NPDC127106 TaxID=3345360 RepID=UPI00363453B7